MMKATTEKPTRSAITLPSLKSWNVWLAFIHAIQGAVILLLSATKIFPVETHYLTLDPVSTELAGHPVLGSAMRHMFDINLAYLVAAFFFIAAIAHGIAATVYRDRYEADLKKKINKLRWIEYALSGSTMIVAIAVLSGVADFSTLVMLFVVNAFMYLLSLAMEVYNQGKSRPNWLVYILGVVAGIVPWFVFGVYIWGANIYGSGDIPGFVYGIYVSMFLLTAAFAANLYLQYKKSGQWKDFLYSERVFMILSLVAKTVLAWQIFAGALRP